VSIRYEPELHELNRAGVIDDAAASRAIALDRGAAFSVFAELRVGLYGAVALITTGVGILIKQNLDRIGPITIIGAIAAAAALCYASALRAHLRANRSMVDDYILLLGALLLSADVAYAESQFHWLDASWSSHLLTLAIIHGITAYLLDSRLVLSVALASLAGWFGLERNAIDVLGFHGQPRGLGWRMLACSVTVLGARLAHERWNSRRAFQDVFEHFAANLAFWAALAWCSDEAMRFIGMLLLTALATASAFRGLRARQEMFVVYGVGYAAIGYCIVAAALIRGALPTSIVLLLIAVSAAVLLWHLRSRMKEPAE
jgi:hypothetical protein